MSPFESVVATRDPKNLRRRQPLDEPLPATIRWVAKLPDEVRPIALLRTFPRIANVLARVWNDAAECQAYFDDLMVDQRGNRSGFPPEVLENLLTLRDYYLGRYPQSPLPRRDLSS
jgi:hypothetical protein